ncbi:MAG: hypothetical protein WCC97_18670 [Candidatus Acidiferrales bacterium]
MSENAEEAHDPLDTISSAPIGSPASRAAARAAAGGAGAPILVTEYITGTRGEDGRLMDPRCLSRTAEVNGREFVRAEGESDADFRKRCYAACFVFKLNLVTFRGDAGE